MANFIGFTCIRSPSSQTRTRPETWVWWLSKPETRVWQKGSGFRIPTGNSILLVPVPCHTHQFTGRLPVYWYQLLVPETGQSDMALKRAAAIGIQPVGIRPE